MSSLLEGQVDKVAFDLDSKIVHFIIQTIDGKYSRCEYIYDDDLPLRKNDTVFCFGTFNNKYINGENVNIFECSSLTARYQFDLMCFLIDTLPYMKLNKANDINDVTAFYRESTSKIMEYCRMTMGDNKIDNICKLLNNLYDCMSVSDDKSLLEFSKYCFGSENIKKIKNFLKLFNNEVLIRPLQLLGLNLDEIKLIHIPLDVAYKIIKGNPYRIPQIPLSKAQNIIENHLRLEKDDIIPVNHEKLKSKSLKSLVCGHITRMVYENLQNRNWMCTPVSKILEKFEEYADLKEDLIKFYFCFEEFDSVYFEPIYRIERNIAKKLSILVQKKDNVITEPIYPRKIPSEKQQIAIKGSLTKWLSLIHGGPGTGKTFVMSELIRTINVMKKKVLCLAFTGAATTRIRDTTKENDVFHLCTIKTINMAITMKNMIIDQKFDYFIIDEISMVNSKLFSELITSFRTLDYKLILIGDINQLEPIGYGNLMAQILKTPINKYFLDENFRSERTIINICDNIINPERITNQNNVNWLIPDIDYTFKIGNLSYLDSLISYYANKFEIDTTVSNEINFNKFEIYRDKFTIISPYKKVVSEINTIFQKYFMSHITEYVEIDYKKFYLGDRVMKLINDRYIEVMNGELGKVIKITNNYIVCIFRNEKSTITPYIGKNKFTIMRKFVKDANITFSAFKKVDDKRVEKTKEEIKEEIDKLKLQFKPIIEDEKLSSETKEAYNLYFELLNEYPKVLCSFDEQAEFFNINNITLAYAVTTHKSQGSQYDNTIFFLNGNMNSFVTINNVYTACSRAKEHLDIVTESLEILNSACLRKQRYVYDKLYQRINQSLPIEMSASLELEVVEEEVVYDDFDCCDADNYIEDW
jgi:hypothetical protein